MQKTLLRGQEKFCRCQVGIRLAVSGDDRIGDRIDFEKSKKMINENLIKVQDKLILMKGQIPSSRILPNSLERALRSKIQIIGKFLSVQRNSERGALCSCSFFGKKQK